jgi:hypothetical protein
MNKNTYGKEKYESIEIPKELDVMINNTIKSNRNKQNKYKKIAVSLTAASAIAVFSLTLNVNESFAQSVTEIPLFGQMAKVLIFKDYSFENKDLKADVVMPRVEQLENIEFEEKINKVIQEKVDQVLLEANFRANEYKEAYISTGGTEELYAENKIEVKVNYEVLSKNENTLSFLVYSTDTLAAVYAENMYFNLDIQNNQVLTLDKLIGEDYVNVVTESVLETIKRQKENQDKVFFDLVYEPDWKIREDVAFYINSNNNVVVVLDKYEIAPGSMGRLEYEIKIK